MLKYRHQLSASAPASYFSRTLNPLKHAFKQCLFAARIHLVFKALPNFILNAGSDFFALPAEPAMNWCRKRRPYNVQTGTQQPAMNPISTHNLQRFLNDENIFKPHGV
jgi:hypothetical protein